MANAQTTMNDDELEAHLTAFLARGANMDDLDAELARLGITDPDAEVAEDGKVVLAESDVVPGSTRKHPNIRDMAAKYGCDAQDVAEGMLRKRKALWEAQARAERVYRRQKAQLDAWLAEMKKPFATYESRIEYMMAEYVADFHPGEKTVKLIEGVLKTTKCADKTAWLDDEAYLEVAARLANLVYELDEAGTPQEEADAAVLALAKKLIAGYSKSGLKEGLTAKGRSFADADGVVVSYIRKEAPAEATRFSIVQEGVGGKVGDDDDD